MKRMLERITKDTFDEIYPIFEEAFPVERLFWIDLSTNYTE